MKRIALLQLFLLVVALHAARAIQPPTGLVSLAGDQSIVLHWDRNTDANLAGYRVYRSTAGAGGPFSLASASLLPGPGYYDITIKVVNGQTNFYYATAVDTNSQESLPSETLGVLPHAFASNDEFLEYVQHTSFDYFWYGAKPANGLVPDRSAPGSFCSIAAVGFGLTAIGIAIDHGWITRTQAVARVLTTLNTFLNGPQGPGSTGVIGYKGWFYHFLDMNTALRLASDVELSSIDTTLLLGGILYAKQYFNGPSADEVDIRAKADAIFNRVDWAFMSQGTNAVAMGWQPTTGFTSFGNWIGYNEAMILYILGLGTTTNPLPASAWSRWTNGYPWGTFYGQTFVPFPPLFGHEYSHCWIDFRHLSDGYMNSHNTTYFENSRRAALAEVAYCSTAPHLGYSSTIWGLTACDGPNRDGYAGYAARGLPPGLDDGTIAPTAAGGAMAFTPEYSLPTLRAFYASYRVHIWSEYGFRDAFNFEDNGWYDTDELGIDQGPIVVMIENYRTQRVWQLFMQNAEVQRGMQRAGFVHLPFVVLNAQVLPTQSAFQLTWNATSNRYYQVEYSPDLVTWAASPGFVQATNNGTFNWLDVGPPVTVSVPSSTSKRFYRVFQIGSP
jgi:hypothetical protein